MEFFFKWYLAAPPTFHPDSLSTSPFIPHGLVLTLPPQGQWVILLLLGVWGVRWRAWLAIRDSLKSLLHTPLLKDNCCSVLFYFISLMFYVFLSFISYILYAFWNGGILNLPVLFDIRDGFDSRRYQIFWEVVVLKQGPLSLVSTTEELLGRNNSDSGLERLRIWP
jgi:hypothetical protein